jgi:hypothetical protein
LLSRRRIKQSCFGLTRGSFGAKHFNDGATRGSFDPKRCNEMPTRGSFRAKRCNDEAFYCSFKSKHFNERITRGNFMTKQVNEMPFCSLFNPVPGIFNGRVLFLETLCLKIKQ